MSDAFWGSMLLLCALFILKRNDIDKAEEKADTVSIKWTINIFLNGKCWEHLFLQHAFNRGKTKEGGEENECGNPIRAIKSQHRMNAPSLPRAAGRRSFLLEKRQLPACLAARVPAAPLWQPCGFALITHVVITFRWFIGSFKYIYISGCDTCSTWGT